MIRTVYLPAGKPGPVLDQDVAQATARVHAEEGTQTRVTLLQVLPHVDETHSGRVYTEYYAVFSLSPV